MSDPAPPLTAAEVAALPLELRWKFYALVLSAAASQAPLGGGAAHRPTRTVSDCRTDDPGGTPKFQ
ncbi:hypothetical protein [Cereibacter azotoformans]|uniref:hypothetical protein n=1 Tax=Cereibacter azotoformans TaxID=43057 RepID=UPI00117BC77A|nr:hypothetical protein [Cereibacter azotoformans]